uniref:Uncharacterized protein n=1 Tax=viral metagenome TaxID=1070528 RepID=A0A6M3KVI5_9ZZZZ
MNENENENVTETTEKKRQRTPKTLPRILGDFTEVMKAQANGELNGKTFEVHCDPDEIKVILERECFVTAFSEEAAIRGFLSSLPIRAVRVMRKEHESRQAKVLAEWKDSLTQVGRDAQPPEGE